MNLRLQKSNYYVWYMLFLELQFVILISEQNEYYKILKSESYIMVESQERWRNLNSGRVCYIGLCQRNTKETGNLHVNRLRDDHKLRNGHCELLRFEVQKLQLSLSRDFKYAREECV